jgi:hypothetical protein
MPPEQVNVPTPIQPEPVKSVSFFERKIVWISAIAIILVGAGAYFLVSKNSSPNIISQENSDISTTQNAQSSNDAGVSIEQAAVGTTENDIVSQYNTFLSDTGSLFVRIVPSNTTNAANISKVIQQKISKDKSPDAYRLDRELDKITSGNYVVYIGSGTNSLIFQSSGDIKFLPSSNTIYLIERLPQIGTKEKDKILALNLQTQSIQSIAETTDGFGELVVGTNKIAFVQGTQLVAADSATGKTQMLGDRNSIGMNVPLFFSQDGKNLFGLSLPNREFIGNGNLKVVDLTAAKISAVDVPPSFAVPSYNPRPFLVSPNGRLVLYPDTATNVPDGQDSGCPESEVHNQVKVFDAQTQSLKTVLNGSASDIYSNLQWLPDGSGFSYDQNKATLGTGIVSDKNCWQGSEVVKTNLIYHF